MSPHAPPHLKHIAPVLMAGEDVRWMSKPALPLLLMLEGVAAVILFVAFLLFFSIFSGLPLGIEVCLAVLAALAAAGILHVIVGMREYVVTDQRLLIISGFSHEVHDSCDLHEIASVSRPRFLRSLIVERRHGSPVRLWALSDTPGAMEAMNVGQLELAADGGDEAEEENV
jgi:hypothetical protein